MAPPKKCILVFISVVISVAVATSVEVRSDPIPSEKQLSHNHDGNVWKDFNCPAKNGHYPHPYSCELYFECRSGKATLKYCSRGDLYDEERRECMERRRVKCKRDGDKGDDDGISKNFDCPSNSGRYPHPHSCEHYFECHSGRATLKHCSRGDLYDEERRECRDERRVKCRRDGDNGNDDGEDYKCPYPSGAFAHPVDCSKYYVCKNNQPSLFQCRDSFLFDERARKCLIEKIVNCGNRLDRDAMKTSRRPEISTTKRVGTTTENPATTKVMKTSRRPEISTTKRVATTTEKPASTKVTKTSRRPEISTTKRVVTTTENPETTKVTKTTRRPEISTTKRVVTTTENPASTKVTKTSRRPDISTTKRVVSTTENPATTIVTSSRPEISTTKRNVTTTENPATTKVTSGRPEISTTKRVVTTTESPATTKDEKISSVTVPDVTKITTTTESSTTTTAAKSTTTVTPVKTTIKTTPEASTTTTPQDTTIPTDPTTTVSDETTTSPVPVTKPNTPPPTDCDEKDLECIIDETGDVQGWFDCPEMFGHFPHGSSKQLFIHCDNWKPFIKKCADGTEFSPEYLVCVWMH